MRTALMRDTQRLALQCGRTTGIFMRFSTTFAVSRRCGSRTTTTLEPNGSSRMRRRAARKFGRQSIRLQRQSARCCASSRTAAAATDWLHSLALQLSTAIYRYLVGWALLRQPVRRRPRGTDRQVCGRDDHTDGRRQKRTWHRVPNRGRRQCARVLASTAFGYALYRCTAPACIVCCTVAWHGRTAARRPMRRQRIIAFHVDKLHAGALLLRGVVGTVR